jgi:hypothetical protein
MGAHLPVLGTEGRRVIAPLIQSPCWRWEVACQAAEYTVAQATYHARHHDPLVRAATSFKRNADAGLDVEPWQLVANAYELFTGHPQMRQQVECLLLAGAETQTIAKCTGLESDLIECFHNLFFDVRDRPQLWINACLFQGTFASDLDERDRIGIQHRLAYALGSDAYIALQSGRLTDAARSKILAVARDILAQQLLGTVLVHGGDPDVVARLVTALAVAAPKQTASVEIAEKGHGEVVMAFLRSVPLQVADPDDPAFRDPSAREPRAHIALREALDATGSHIE